MFKEYMKLIRIHQWLKNLMLYFPPILGGALFTKCLTSTALLPFTAFCCASSATYIVNDLCDSERDRLHPEKILRPIASGRVSRSRAVIIIGVLLSTAFMLGMAVSAEFSAYIAAYLLISLAYSFYLKHLAIVDIFCISAGFILRLNAGGSAFGVPVSEWLFLSVFLLSIFLSTGKRMAELQRLGDSASIHRASLVHYPRGFLDGVMYLSGGAVLVTYTMYVISRHSQLMLYTVPLSCFGLLRYLLRVQSGMGGDPTDSLTRDIPLFIVGLLWVGMIGWGIYG